MLLSWAKSFLSSWSPKDKAEIIASFIKDNKISKEQKLQIISNAVKAIPSADQTEVVQATTSQADADTKRQIFEKILKDAIIVAAAGGKGYLLGGPTGAEVAAVAEALRLIQEANNKSGKTPA